MDYSLTEEQEMLKGVARDFFLNELPKALVEEMAADEKGYTPDLWQKMADLGWTGLIIPEAYGGFGGQFLDLMVLMEEMGRARLPGPFFSTVILGAMILLEVGSESQKAALLPSIAAGDTIVALAFIEPEALYSPDFLETEAKAADGGYTINGTKLFVTNANVADLIICLAKTGSGTTLFLVDPKVEGVTCTLLPTISGEKQCEVIFEGVKVSADSIVGDVNKGWSYIDKVLSTAALARCAEMLGGAQRVLEMSVDYAKERIAFGKPIGAQQSVQHHCANMLIDVEGMRYSTCKAAWLMNEGQPCIREIAVAKAWANEAYHRVSYLGHQVHGGVAFQQDHDMHLYIKQAALGEVSFGDTAYYEEIVAGQLGL